MLTIKDNDSQPAISIADVSQAEGNSGTTSFVFNVTLSATSGQTVKVNFATQDGSAQSGSDYQPASGLLTWMAKPGPGTVSSRTLVFPTCVSAK